jgi:hypothetical protein
MIIGILGGTDLEKSVVVEVLTQHFCAIEVGIYDPIKRFCRDMFRFSSNSLWGSSNSRSVPDSRYTRVHAGYLGSCYVGNTDLKGTVFDGCAELVKNGCIPSPPRDEYLTPQFSIVYVASAVEKCCPGMLVRYLIRTYDELQHGGIYDKTAGVCESHDGVLVNTINIVVPDLFAKADVGELRNSDAYIIHIVSHTSESDSVETCECDAVILNSDTTNFKMRVFEACRFAMGKKTDGCQK